MSISLRAHQGHTQLSGESNRPLTPILLQKYRDTPPISIVILLRKYPLVLAESRKYSANVYHDTSHLYRDTLAEVLGSGVVGTPPQLLPYEMPREHSPLKGRKLEGSEGDTGWGKLMNPEPQSLTRCPFWIDKRD